MSESWFQGGHAVNAHGFGDFLGDDEDGVDDQVDEDGSPGGLDFEDVSITGKKGSRKAGMDGGETYAEPFEAASGNDLAFLAGVFEFAEEFVSSVRFGSDEVDVEQEQRC